MSYETIHYEVEDGRARVTLNRPEKRNALTYTLQRELADALWDADEDERVHAVILKGAGDVFCAGYDFTDGSALGGEGRRGMREIDDDIWHLERQQRLRMALFDMHKPTIAQVHGTCIAGGTDLALLCDMVIVADDARIGFPPVRDLGSPPNHMWLYLCGPQWAKRMLLTGDSLTGAEAAQIGLALKAVPAAELEAEVEGLADRLALVDPHLLAANKRVVNMGLELMGARTLQRFACENDARGHRAPAASHFRKALAEKGVKAAYQERDAKFGSGFAKVAEPEGRG